MESVCLGREFFCIDRKEKLCGLWLDRKKVGLGIEGEVEDEWMKCVMCERIWWF